MSEGTKKPDGFVDLLAGMTAEEVCAVNSNVRPVNGSPIDEVVEAIGKAARESNVPSDIVEAFVATAKDGGDQIAGLLSLMRGSIPTVAKEAADQTTLAAKVLEVAEKYGVSLPVLVAKEADGDGDGNGDEEEAAAAGDDDKGDAKDGDGDGDDAEESAAAKSAKAANDRIDAHEARQALDKAVGAIAIPGVAKLVREEVDRQIEAGLKPDKVVEAVNSEIQRTKRAAEAMSNGASSFDDLEPTDLDVDLSRTTESEGLSAGEAAFYG